LRTRHQSSILRKTEAKELGVLSFKIKKKGNKSWALTDKWDSNFKTITLRAKSETPVSALSM
jgi:hypothetical protein